MATVAPPAEPADLLQKMSLDSQTKTLEIPEPNKKPSVNQYGSIDSGNAANGQIPAERSVTPLLPDFTDPSMCYLPNSYPSTAYYYGGYDGTGSEWDDYSRYVNHEGVEMTSGVYGDNGSLIYHHGYGYAPYAPYSPAGSPVPTMGNDGQLYGPQQYQYPPYFQPLTPTSGPYTPNPAAPQTDVATSVAADQKPLSVETANGISNGIANGGGVKGNNVSAPSSTYQNSSFNSNGSYGRGALPGRVPTPGYQDPRFGFDGLRSPRPWLDVPLFSDGQPRPVTSTITSSISNGNTNLSSRNQNYRPNSHYMGLHHPRPLSGMGAAQGFINRMYPSKLYGQYGNTVRSGMGFGSHGYDSRINGRAWLAVDNKYKPRGRNGGYYGYGNENMDGLNELNRGPRAKSSKNQKGFAPNALAIKGQVPMNPSNDEENEKTSVPDQEQYNKADFPEEYTDAKFFIIKSYSEDDVHKSIKYNVWASTPNGNKKLHAAYQEAQEKSGGCPVFLLFSVNTSGQFVGLAEMLGPVDFNKNLEYWQQDKWNGCFPVKWHIVKDVPNSLLKHITLENNENKPVTNSRDTQEVKWEPGLKIIKIFKEHISKTCILDDFGFYEARQKAIQEKKAKQQQFQKQNLALESQTKGPDDIPDPASARKPVVVTSKSKSYDRSTAPLRKNFMDPSACHLPNGYTSSAYYYGGYDGTGNEWGGISSYVNPNGNDVNSAVYGDNGSFMYHHGYGYAPYSTYSTSGSPVSTVGSDVQLYGPQQYQYPPYFKQLKPNSGSHTPNSAVPSQGAVSTTKDAGHKPSLVGTANGNPNGVLASVCKKGNSPSDFSKPTYKNSSLNLKGSCNGYYDAIYGFDGLLTPTPWFERPMYSNGLGKPMTGNTVNRTPSSKNQTSRSNSQFMDLYHMRMGYGMDTANGLVNGMYTNELYGHYWNPVRLGMGFGSNGFGMHRNGSGWTALQNKYKTRGRDSSFRFGNQDIEGLDELNKGPRVKGLKNQKGNSPVAVAVKGNNMLLNKVDNEKDAVSIMAEQEQYIGTDICDHYADAKFFIIKSYSEDDVHKSVKYNVWASTPNGNNKLHAAYQEAQEKSGGCPVFLFFSVNASGQFVGLAEMVGLVDFNKNVEYWQQDKWTGYFPVKWHIVKDVPNSLLKHITLENNDNKPVTNSRDTQEVKPEQGLKMIKMFKDHSSKTSLLDDFEFYEARQKTIQENKAKQQIRKQVLDGKPSDGRNDGANEALKSLDSFGTALDSIKEPTPSAETGEELKLSENGLVAETGGNLKAPELAVTEMIVTK